AMPVDSDAATRLRSLGYVVSTAPKPARAFTSADDPKRLVHLDAMLDAAAAALGRDDAAAAVATLQAVLGERPDLTIADDRLGFAPRASGRPARGVRPLGRPPPGGARPRAPPPLARVRAARSR